MPAMRVIVIGLGEVGRNVALTLSAERHQVTIVDTDEARVQAAQGELDALVLCGNGASPKFLREIGAAEADLLCAVTQSDEVNIIAALAGRQLGAANTVARVRDEDWYDGGASEARDVLGIDYLIQPERATAENIAQAVLLPGAVEVTHFADERLSVAETLLTERSPLVGRALADRRLPRENAIVGIIRGDRAVAADPTHRPKVGDHVLVAAARGDIAASVAAIAGRTTEVRDTVILGGGRIGRALARRLHEVPRMRVTVLERDAAIARTAAEKLPHASVIHEEGVSKDSLLAQGVDRVGAFAACTGDDRTNLLAAMHAGQLGAGLTLAIVSREEFTPLVDALGVGASFSSRVVTAEAILRAVRGSNVASLHLVAGGGEILEVTVDPGCRAEGRRARDAGTLARTSVAAIIRDDRVLLADPDDVVRGGDRLLLFNQRRGVADISGAFHA